MELKILLYYLISVMLHIQFMSTLVDGENEKDGSI